MSLLEFDSNQTRFVNTNNYSPGQIYYNSRSNTYFYCKKNNLKEISPSFAARKILEKASEDYLETLSISRLNKRKVSLRVAIPPLDCKITLYTSDRVAKIALEVTKRRMAARRGRYRRSRPPPERRPPRRERINPPQASCDSSLIDNLPEGRPKSDLVLFKVDYNQRRFVIADENTSDCIYYDKFSKAFFSGEKNDLKKLPPFFVARRILEKAPIFYLEALRAKVKNKRKIVVHINFPPLDYNIMLPKSNRAAQIIYDATFPRIVDANKRAYKLVKQIVTRTNGLRVMNERILVDSSKGKYSVSLTTANVYRGYDPLSEKKRVCVVLGRLTPGKTSLPTADVALAKALTILKNPDLIYTIRA
ncbi:MAG: hypothetical protein ACFFDI_12870 [Promethearchaeota archaeon]